MSQDDNRELQEVRAEIAFGLDVQKFMGSTLGKYLTAKANADRDRALEALCEADAEDPKAIRKLQNDIKCAENFLLWMGEAVTAGENAERTYVENHG